MVRKLLLSLTATLSLAAASPTAAQQPATEAQPATETQPASAPIPSAVPPPAPPAVGKLELAAPPSDKSNYFGDKIRFRTAIFVKKYNLTVQPFTDEDGCAPEGTEFVGIGSIKLNGEPVPLFRVEAIEDSGPLLPAKRAQGAELNKCSDPAKMVKAGDVVTFAKDAVTSLPPGRFGLTYGTLLVPYKYRFTTDKDFSGNASLGGYFGYRQDDARIGFGIQAVVFIGAANVEVATANSDGSVTTQNLTGISYGVAYLFNVKDSFRMGIVLGRDRVNKSANWKYNGRSWVAASVGYAFSN